MTSIPLDMTLATCCCTFWHSMTQWKACLDHSRTFRDWSQSSAVCFRSLYRWAFSPVWGHVQSGAGFLQGPLCPWLHSSFVPQFWPEAPPHHDAAPPCFTESILATLYSGVASVQPFYFNSLIDKVVRCLSLWQVLLQRLSKESWWLQTSSSFTMMEPTGLCAKSEGLQDLKITVSAVCCLFLYSLLLQRGTSAGLIFQYPEHNSDLWPDKVIIVE